MTDTNDKSAIDKKKEETSGIPNNNEGFANLASFVYTVLILFIIITIYFTTSGLLLHACKLGQSNILPTDIDCFPYKETKSNIQPIQTNIFATLSEPQLSMKLKFPYDEYNASNKLLDMFREYKNSPSSNFLANYFISIIETLIQFNYSSFNTILNMLNGLPEVLIILFGPIVVGIITTILFMIDNIYIVYLWFTQMSWFFKKNKNDTDIGKPIWKDVSLFNMFDYFCAVSLVIIFIIILFFSFPFISVITFLAMCWCIITCITYKAEMYGKSVTAANIVIDVFKYYKISIMFIFSFFVIVTAFTKLGTIPGVFSIITLALIYYGIITIDIFKPIKELNLSPIVSYKQAIKTCSNKTNSKPKEKHGLLYSLLFGQSGEDITKELKNIAKINT